MEKEKKKKPSTKSRYPNRRTQTEEENRQQDVLNEYLRNEIFKCTEKQKLPSYLWLKIQSLRAGEVCLANGMKNTPIYYTFEDILFAFKWCKPEILKCLNNMHFHDDGHRINTIMVIIDRNIFMIKERLEKRNQNIIEETNENLENTAIVNSDVNYIPKNKDNINPELERLW